MGKPKVAGYTKADPNGGVWEMPVSLLTATGEQTLRSAGWRPIYQDRPFKARVSADGGYLLECRTCGTQEECNPSTLLHDRAVLHDRELHSGGPRRVPPMGVVG